MLLPLVFLIISFTATSLEGKKVEEPLTFHDIHLATSLASTEVFPQDHLPSLDLQPVHLRGFLHEKKPGYVVITTQPNVPSCCVGKKEKAQEQILIKGDGHPIQKGRIVELTGTLRVNPLYGADRENSYLLWVENVEWIEFSAKPFWAGMALFAAFVCALYAIFRKKKRHKIRTGAAH